MPLVGLCFILEIIGYMLAGYAFAIAAIDAACVCVFGAVLVGAAAIDMIEDFYRELYDCQ